MKLLYKNPTKKQQKGERETVKQFLYKQKCEES